MALVCLSGLVRSSSFQNTSITLSCCTPAARSMVFWSKPSWSSRACILVSVPPNMGRFSHLPKDLADQQMSPYRERQASPPCHQSIAPPPPPISGRCCNRVRWRSALGFCEWGYQRPKEKLPWLRCTSDCIIGDVREAVNKKRPLGVLRCRRTAGPPDKSAVLGRRPHPPSTNQATVQGSWHKAPKPAVSPWPVQLSLSRFVYFLFFPSSTHLNVACFHCSLLQCHFKQSMLIQLKGI